MIYYVYIIKSLKSDSYYVGFTSNVRQRIKDHNSGKTKSTNRNKPYKLVYFEGYYSKSIARSRELQLKQKRKAKEEIIRRLENEGLASSSNG